MSDPTPNPVPVAPEDEPDQIFPSATGVVVPDDSTGAGGAAANGAHSSDS